MFLGGKRVCGKTTELVKISSNNQIPIVVLNYRRRELVEYIAKKEGLKIPKPIIFEKYREMIGRRPEEILIDDVEDILQSIFLNTRIIAMTTSVPFMLLSRNNEKEKK